MHSFQVIKQLGSGSFGRVLKVRRKEDQRIYAMKIIWLSQLTPKQKQNALNEVRLLASINSPNVIKYKGAFFQQFDHTLSIIMEFADGGDIAGLIQKNIAKYQSFQQNFIWKVALDILNGLKFLHQNNIIHRDIKSANIFFVNGVAKLGDLNISKVIQGNFATTQAGTPYYTSPQIWKGEKYTANCDIWSLGCLLYELCCFKLPFMAQDFPELMKRVISGYYEPIPSKYSKKLSFLIRKCLIVDHLKRPTAKQLLQTDVFQMMASPQQGQIYLLDTIRCPRVLHLLNKQLSQKLQNRSLEKQKHSKSIYRNNYENSQKLHIPHQNNYINNSKIVHNNENMIIQRGKIYSKPRRIIVQNIQRKQTSLSKVIPIHNNVINSDYLKMPKVFSYRIIR